MTVGEVIGLIALGFLPGAVLVYIVGRLDERRSLARSMKKQLDKIPEDLKP